MTLKRLLSMLLQLAPRMPASGVEGGAPIVRPGRRSPGGAGVAIVPAKVLREVAVQEAVLRARAHHLHTPLPVQNLELTRNQNSVTLPGPTTPFT